MQQPNTMNYTYKKEISMNKFLFQAKLQAILLDSRIPTGEYEAPEWYVKLQGVLLHSGTTLNEVDKQDIKNACARVRNRDIKDLVRF